MKVLNLKRIIEVTGAEVVIVSHANSILGSSFDEERINKIKEYGVNPLESLKTGFILWSKDITVKNWLNAHNDIEKFIIIDDKSENFFSFPNNLLWIKGNRGLTNKYVEEAIKMLN